MWKLTLERKPLIEIHGELPHEIEHKHDTDSHQHNASAYFNQTDVLAETLKSSQKLVEEKTGDQKRDTQSQGVD